MDQSDIPTQPTPTARVDSPAHPAEEPPSAPPPEPQSVSSASRPRSPQPKYQIPHHSAPISQLLLDPSLVDHPLPNPASRPRTPSTKPLTPKVGSPVQSAVGAGENLLSLGPEASRLPGERPLNVSDALTYLDEVKVQFADQPDVYNQFLDIMKDFKSQAINTPGVIERVSTLFQGNPRLIQGFNTFLPPGYKIELSNDPRNIHGITVTTPQGVILPQGHMGAPLRLPRETPANLHPAFPAQAFAPPVLPVGVGPGSRPATPMIHTLSQHVPGYIEQLRSYSPGMQANMQQTAAANLVGTNVPHGPGNRNGEPAEFNHAIHFLNRIKLRYSDEPDTYKQFLEILQNYQKESNQMRDQAHVYAQAAVLFKNSPDLLNEFRAFLPEGPIRTDASAGLMSIMPHPTGAAAWEQGVESPSLAAEKPKAATRRRKRAADKEPVAAAQKGPGGRAAKKAKTAHKPEPGSPKFAVYEHPPSPQPPLVHHHPPRQIPFPPPPHLNGTLPQPIPGGIIYAPAPPSEFAFFDRVKKALESGGTYEEFLKLLNLFARDIIDLDNLIERAEIFLDPELMRQFKELLAWEDRYSTLENGPPGSIRTSAPDLILQPPNDGLGPSYRRLPDSEVKLACSGRDQLARAVLNDEWVSHPTWASEESGFVSHRKTTFEETLHKCEEERHDYQVYLDGLTRTIAVLTPIDARLEEMTPEERSSFKLKPDLGGSCKAIYSRTLRRIYGRDAGIEVIRGLCECPSVAVPVVLARCKMRYDEVSRLQREWNRTWKEIDAKNFYKALDSQGITFKASDKKNITTKAFVHEIEGEMDAKMKERNAQANRKAHYGSAGPQLQYEMKDLDVLQDALKLIYSFLDHNHSTYSPSERRSIEKFLQSFVPLLFTISHPQFTAASGSITFNHDQTEDAEQGGRRSVSESHSTGIPARDLHKRLLKTVSEGHSLREKGKDSTSQSESASPMVLRSPKEVGGPGSRSSPRSNPEDICIREFLGGPDERRTNAGETAVSGRPFYANTTFYTLLRLLQLLYSRLQTCKETGAKLAKEKHASLKSNPIAVQLGLEDPSGPSVVLSQAIEAVGNVTAAPGEEPNVLYMYLLDACEKVFENELDQATFEEHMRWFFGAKAYQMFTLDRVIMAIIKQVQTITGDNKCQELWDLLQKARRGEMATIHEIVRYRREAERNAGSDEHLYKVDWDMRSRTLRIQLLDTDDPSIEEDGSQIGRWRQYVGSYVTRYPTELLPQGEKVRAKAEKSRLFLKRSLIDGDIADREDVQEIVGMGVCVDVATYRISYEAGTEDVLWRARRADEDELAARAQARSADRGRWRWLR